MSFIEDIKNRAREDLKTIILPEAEDIRVIKAAKKVVTQGFANIVLLGDEEKVFEICQKNNIDIEGVTIINPLKSHKKQEYIQKLYELRKTKGMTIEQAEELLKEPIYFGMMMLDDETSNADGLVSGAAHSTANTLRPALQILKTAPGTKLVSAFFVMCVPNCEYGEKGTFIFGDSGLNENPTAEELAQIAISSSNSFKNLVGKEPKVAMLSYSTYGSAKSELTQKVVEATEILNKIAPEIKADGELQLDAAIVPEVSKLKAPGSRIEGNANVLIFPDLNAGNIGYKLVQRLAKAEAYGPLCQGIKKPVNDLSRGCSVDDIVGVVAITAVQAK